MSDISKCNAPKKPSDIQEVSNDIQISQNKNDHWRKNVFQWTVLGWLIIGISAIAILFLYNLFKNVEFQVYILNQIKNNAVFIALTVFAILKIQIPDLQKWC